MRRDQQVGRHQMRVLMTLTALDPRPVDARLLAYVANDGGDQTQGNRVLASMEERKLIERDSISRAVDRTNVLKWRLTREGRVTFLENLPRFVDRLLTSEAL
jgi:hypothetical protein